jgi:tocopherol cyclase
MRRRPHSGCHWDGRRSPFFEGWYYRLTLPPQGDAAAGSIAFMVSLQTPPGSRRGWAEMPAGFGGAIQVLGPHDQLVARSFPDLATFWARRDQLAHGQSRRSDGEFFHASERQHGGFIRVPATGEEIRWCFAVEPRYGWGAPHRRQQSTAGWLSRFPIFEPGWQILMAHGRASGWIEWSQPAASPAASPESSLRRHFVQVPAYAEKNWGGAFPSRWFWMQCNAFAHQPDLTLTAAGGIRKVLGRPEWAGLVGIHHQGRFHEFVPWNARLGWQVDPWGRWRMEARTRTHRVELLGTCSDDGVWVQVPTAAGLRFLCRDSTCGEMRLKLWRRRNGDPELLLDAVSRQAALEVGGDGWDAPWVKDL